MTRLLEPGRNCDPLARADRFALLIDGASYYAALADCIVRATRSVIILGWDLDSRVRLGPGAAVDGGELLPPLREFLPEAAEASPDLHIYVLTWDFPLLFANVRDPELVRGRDPFKHPRVHLTFDSTHPPGASHHQKIAVVDDGVAFAGGMDLAGGRWDTDEHRACDERRAGKDRPYPPTHDVQAVVDGEAARALAAIVRERWHRATGTSIPDGDPGTTAWPANVRPDFEDVLVGISRTDVARLRSSQKVPATSSGEAPRHSAPDVLRATAGGDRFEIERLHLDLIDAARQFLYIENQYLTSALIVSALSRTLEAADGPEVIIVLPLKNSGWLEEHTIEVLRFDSIRRLRAADRFGRLRVCYPVVPDLDGDAVQVHSKILVVDDRLFRVGSSNLTNRSMRLDTECDLTIEASDARERGAVVNLRNRLLAEHLGLSVEAVAAALANDPSVVRLVDSRLTASRCLRELQPDSETVELPIGELVDPSRPLTADVVIEALATSVPVSTRTILGAALACVAIALGAWAFARRIRTRSLPEMR
jgi:phospholipase D1/2